MSQELTTIDDFKVQLYSDKAQGNFREFLPNGPEGDKLLKRFTAVTIRAVQEDPDLLDADRHSLLMACQRASQDRLLPDKREGAFVVYNTKTKIDGKDVWIKKVQWQPMIQGIRKRLAKAGFHMAAEVYYEKDEFSFELGDSPQIIHRPYLQGDRGPMKGAYAIATNLETGEKYREHMNLVQLEQVRSKSKRPNAGPWKDFPEEMHRKSPAKRLLKYLPLDETDIFDMIDRDNEQFDMNKPAGPSQTARDVQEAVRSANEPIEGELEEPKPEPKPEPEKRPNVRKARTPDEIQEAQAEIDMQEAPAEEEPPPMTDEEVDPLGF